MGGSLGSIATRTAESAGRAAAVLAIFGAGHANAQEATKPAHKLVRIGTFEIDRHEVTVGQFHAFWKATQIKTKAERDGGGFQYVGGWRRMAGWTWAAPNGDMLGRHDTPVVHVTWHEAKAYCEWMGLRLPTDAEWVEAAYTERRPSPPAPFVTGRTYPYPSGEGAADANQIESNGKCHFSPPVSVETRDGQRLGHVSVGSCPPGVNGLYDMGGNVWEWVDHDVGGQKRTRGGSWWYGPAQMKADALYEKDPDFPAVYIGFRCAR
jgi:formylglycine-generating enzyme required for sulfatase activity